MFKAFLPCGDGKVVIGHDALFGKHRICGAPGLGGVLGGGEGCYFAVSFQDAVAATQAVDFPGKVVPGGFPQVGIVIDAIGWFRRSHDADDGSGEVVGSGGAALLVCHHSDAFPLLHEAEHGKDKVGAMFTVEPGGAEDDAVRTG